MLVVLDLTHPCFAHSSMTQRKAGVPAGIESDDEDMWDTLPNCDAVCVKECHPLTGVYCTHNRWYCCACAGMVDWGEVCPSCRK